MVEPVSDTPTVEILGLDHVQLAMPPGEEDAARGFYVDVLGLVEEVKPANPQARGGAWFRGESLRLHLGVESDFRPARKAHPAILVRGLAAFRARCAAAGFTPIDDQPLDGFERFYVADPFGNRIELLESIADASMATIRPEAPGDADAIEQVTIDAFAHAPHTSHTEQFIVRDLRRAGALTVSLVAEVGGVIVGHVAISPVRISDGTGGWLGLGPISVVPAHQGAGVGSRLMRAALEQLKATGAAGCALLGEPAFYSRFGFAPAAGLVLPGVPAEYFLASSFNSRVPQGDVTYHDAFNATS